MNTLQAFKKLCVANPKGFYWLYNPIPYLVKDSQTKEILCLDDNVIQQHIDGKVVLGLSPFVDNEHILYGVIDLDVHADKEEDKKKEKIVVEKDLTLLKAELNKLGYSYFVNSSGSDGKHLRVYSKEKIKAKVIRYFLLDLQKRVLGDVNHEVFPKQNKLSDTPNRFGSQVKAVLAIHPKTKKLAGVINEEGKILNREDSLKFICIAAEFIDSMKKIDFEITKEMEKEYGKKTEFTEEDIKNLTAPKKCLGIENVACEVCLPSGKCTRHDYLDGNVFQYCKQNNKPELLDKYKKKQRRDSTAFNECEKWIFNCGAIKKYLNNNTGKDIDKWKKHCKECKQSPSPNKINFLTGKFWTWGKCRGRAINEHLHNSAPLCFFAHNNNKIIGKPLAIHQTIQTITLISVTRKTIRGRNPETITTYNFIDDIVDRRSIGVEIANISMDVWLYKTVYKKKEYIVISKKELSTEEHIFKGMKIDIGNSAEISKTLKIKSLMPMFFVDTATSAIVTLDKKELVKYVKQMDFNEEDFKNFLFLNEDGYVYRHIEKLETLMIAHLLSGKYEGYPLHLLLMSSVGKGKTTFLECLDMKFKETIFEAGNSTLKGLIPSFKEKPANPGFILRCNRYALIDELMKMIEQSITQLKEYFKQQFGQLNMLLEHKHRIIGSGNDNSFPAKATAKVCLATNPLSGKSFLADHIYEMDRTTLSRLCTYVYDKEQNKLMRKKNKLKYINLPIYNKFKTGHSTNSSVSEKTVVGIYTPTHIYTPSYVLKGFATNNNAYNICVGVYTNFFLTIFDSCNIFLVDFDENRIKKVFEEINSSLQQPMKDIFESRYLHHMILMLDGIVKFRCLFKDYDENFTVKDCDYEKMEEMVKFVVSSWDEEFNVDVPGLQMVDDDVI